MNKYLRGTLHPMQRQQCLRQSEYLSLFTEKDVRNRYFLAYQYKCVSDFEEGWLVYEKKLKKYVMTSNKFTDWA